MDVIAFKQFPLVGTNFKFYIWSNLVVFVYECTTNFHSGQCIVVNAEFLKLPNLLFMKPGQIRPLYLEPRLHKQSVKQEINNHGTYLAKPLHTKQQKNVWRLPTVTKYRT
jgi:hypothetical protein